MELLTPTASTRTLLRYQHPVWERYAAATEANFGQGLAMYVGFLPQQTLITQLFDHLTRGIRLRSRTTYARFPLIVRDMTNGQGKRISFIFNYSGEAQNMVCDSGGVALLNETSVAAGTTLQLAPWGFDIIAR